MLEIFELEAVWSIYVYCTFCIAFKLAPTTLQFKRSDIKKYNTINIELIRLCEEQTSLHVFCIYFIRR